MLALPRATLPAVGIHLLFRVQPCGECCSLAIWSNLFLFMVTDPVPVWWHSVYTHVLTLRKPNPVYMVKIPVHLHNFKRNSLLVTPSRQTYPHLSSKSINLHILPVWAGVFPVPLSLAPDCYSICNSKSTLLWSNSTMCPALYRALHAIRKNSKGY